MLTVCYTNRQLGIEGITIPTQMLAARAPQTRETCLQMFASNTGAVQPAHARSLISAFVIRCAQSDHRSLKFDP